jgi:hypothetical protein
MNVLAGLFKERVELLQSEDFGKALLGQELALN